MLKYLKIKNIALAAAVELELEPGLTLLTGETGAGKSILVDALGLVLGGRASADLVRTGEDHASVEALFDSASGARFLAGRGQPTEGDEIVIRRELQASGKGRAWVNGALVPVAVLRDLAPFVATLHGQHEPQGLLDAETHLELLDRHASLAEAAAGVAEPFRRVREIDTQIEALTRDRREQERRREMLVFQLAEIDKAQLLPGEEEDLRQEKVRHANAERLATLSSEAYALLFEDEEAVLGRLGLVHRRVEELARYDSRFAPHLEARASVKAQLEDLAWFLRDYRDALQTSPGRLDEVEDRLALIERLKRKYGGDVNEILAFAERCRDELRDLGSPEERERTLVADRQKAADRYLALAGDLSRRRRLAAREMEKAVQAELTQLAMEKTQFRVAFTPAQPQTEDSTTWTERGLESAEFLLSPNPGETLRPLARIASGGELSRILLALNATGPLDEAGKTVVFDEVDAGIGGRVAEVVGRKLRALAGRQQVLCVTHLPQIAAMADQHHLVSKRVEKGRTVTDVRSLQGSDRVEEVARMLGGEVISETARRHAREMVKQGLRS
jgi:DNA repair protein RecN (Recombination protein N)